VPLARLTRTFFWSGKAVLAAQAHDHSFQMDNGKTVPGLKFKLARSPKVRVV
jgi:hypothetical protein